IVRGQADCFNWMEHELPFLICTPMIYKVGCSKAESDCYPISSRLINRKSFLHSSPTALTIRSVCGKWILGRGGYSDMILTQSASSQSMLFMFLQYQRIPLSDLTCRCLSRTVG